MWWDVERGFLAVDLTGDSTVVVDAALLAVIKSLKWDELRILDGWLRELETYLNALPRLEFRSATAESEAEFIDRPIDGEVILTDPDQDDIFMLATALNQQILAAPARWRLDLHENLCTLVEELLDREPRAERLRRRTIGRLHNFTLRRRALRHFQRARATANTDLPD